MKSKIILILLSVCFLTGCTASNDERIKKAVETVIRQKPDLILDILNEEKFEALNIIEQAIKERRNQGFLNKIKAELKNPLKPTINTNRPFLGKIDAPITIVEYFNFRCSICAEGNRILKKLMNKYPEKIRIFYKHHPFDELGKIGALFFEAIALQNEDLAIKFYEEVFANPERLKKEKELVYENIVAGLNISHVFLAKDIQSKRLSDILNEDVKEAKDFGFKGTPIFLINGAVIRGVPSIEIFEHVIELFFY